ncbi:hypothetical protein PtA15_10A476 [Puccinia triticina]|uniref:Uncharacterized protein n=1 Tax=Puccinia triticina TaxID=208348 RepID=A0ABY7CXH4_9BASI|nr:uncharacterized protein PtA15_10A476 [Puccinia triticina]WAQ89053.1 hypothetical protein PtA15_10A476 [Puccinia triticina]WAR59112.1 hypothetical protein PtB15_10B454 [Puccinia triticina]
MNQEMLESTEEVSSDLAHADAFGSPEQFGEVLHHLMESEARATAFAKRKKQLQNAQSVKKTSLKLEKQLFSSHVIHHIFFTETAFNPG